MTLGWRILAPKTCTLTTEVMPTWRDLAKQRLRWKRGALENLWDYGLTHVTWRYWGRQLLSLISVTATALYLGVLVWSVIAGTFHWQTFWVIVTAVFVVERAVSVRDRGWRQQLVGATLILEFPYDVWLQAVQAWAFLQVALRRKANW